MYFKTGDTIITDISLNSYFNASVQKDAYTVICKPGTIPKDLVFGETVGCYTVEEDGDKQVWCYPLTYFLRVYVEGNNIICTHSPAPPEPTLEELQQQKIRSIQNEIYSNNRQNISIRYTTTEIVEHEEEFSVGNEIQILEAYIQVLHGADKAMLQAENQDAKLYSADVITRLFNEIVKRRSFNSINEQILTKLINNTTTKEELSEITYGMTYSPAIQNEVSERQNEILFELNKIKKVNE